MVRVSSPGERLRYAGAASSDVDTEMGFMAVIENFAGSLVLHLTLVQHQSKDMLCLSEFVWNDLVILGRF